MTTEGKTILAVNAVMFCFGIYGYSELSDRQQSIQLQASTCNCPGDSNCANAVVSLNSLHQWLGANQSYFEHLLEGLVRRQGLPLEKAREAWRKGLAEMKIPVPEGWRDLPAWEGAAPPR